MSSEKTTMKSLGDSAALREALEEIEKILNSWYCPDNSTAAKVVALRNKCRTALAKPPRNCDKLSAEECKRIFAKEMNIYLPPEATDNDRTIATLTANGVIDALYALAQRGAGK